MLAIFVRHLRLCLEGDGKKPGLLAKELSQEKLRTYKNCDCPKWYSGLHEGKWHPRTSLKTTSWEEAEKALAKIKAPPVEVGRPVTIDQAVEAWLEEVILNQAKPSTITSWKMIGQRLVRFCQARNISSLEKLDAIAINQWRAEWAREQTNRRETPGISPATARLRLTVIRLFFKFARRMRWIKESPMDLVRVSNKKRDLEEAVATLPLDEAGDANYRALLQAIPEFLAGKLPRRDGRFYKTRTGAMATRPDHLVAITELMYETGLRVGDAILFVLDQVEIDSEDGWGTYTTTQTKVSSAVTVAIPPELMSRLRTLPRISTRYLFYDGETDLVNYYRHHVWQHLKDVGDAIGIPGVRPHRLRDTFAVNRLNEGMLLQDVSKLLGHASVAMTERYYAPFVKSRKDALVAQRKAAHGSAPASRVVPIRKRRAG
jgi:integrase/recombinase XerD